MTEFAHPAGRRLASLARPLALVLLAVALAGCPSTGPVRSDAAAVAKATRLAGSGRHAEAAELFERVARTARGEQRDALLLDASRAWLEAGQASRALATLDQVTGDLPATDNTVRLLQGYRLLRDGDAAASLTYLNDLRASLPPRYLGLWYELRGRAFFRSGNTVEGVRALVERELWLVQGEDIRNNRELLWRTLRDLAAPGEPLEIAADADAITAGWLALANANATSALDPYGRASALRGWLGEHPNHPGRFVVDEFNASAPALLMYPESIAVLLPLSGRFAGTAAAIRDGLMAAYLADGKRLNRPTVRFYDTSSEDAPVVLQRALADGASFVIGPLLKEQVEAVAAQPVATPMLLLNALPDTAAGHSTLFQFSLAPEHEARAAARRAYDEGMTRAVALVPNSDWGERLLLAFSEELAELGGKVLSYQTYEAGDSDFAVPITQLLNLNESRERYRQIVNAIGTDVEFEPRRRRDAQFVFVASDARQGRLIRPAFLYHFAEDLPVFATSAIYEDDPQANGRDLDGLVFADMPWVLAPDASVIEAQDAFARHWPSRVSRRARLYAMGYDAYRVIPQLLQTEPLNTPWPGVTGQLSLGARGQIRRELNVAVIRGGVAEVLSPIREFEPLAPEPSVPGATDIRDQRDAPGQGTGDQ